MYLIAELYTYTYIKNFITHTVAAFRLLLHKERDWTAAGRVFDNFLHLNRSRKCEPRWKRIKQTPPQITIISYNFIQDVNGGSAPFGRGSVARTRQCGRWRCCSAALCLCGRGAVVGRVGGAGRRQQRCLCCGAARAGAAGRGLRRGWARQRCVCCG